MFTKGMKKLKGKNPQQPTIDSKEYLEMIGNDSKDPTEGHEETTTLPEPIQSSQLLSDLYSKNEEFRAFVNTVLTKNDQQRERARASEKKLKQQYQAVMAVESQLQVYEQTVSEALVRLGYEHGHYNCDQMAEALLGGIDILLESETHLLDRSQEMYDQILQAEAIILSEDRAGARAEEPVSDKVANKPKQGAARAEGAAAQEREEVICSVCKKHAEEAEKGGAKQDIKEPSSELQEKLEAQDEELRQLYTYSTQLLEQICEIQEENTSLRKSHFQTANLSQELMQEVKSYHQNQARWKVEKKALLSLIMDHLSIEDDSEGSDDPSSRFQDSAERQNLYAKLKEILNENGTNKSLDSPRDSAHVSSRPLSAKFVLHESPGAAPGAERSVPHKPKTPGDIDETMCQGPIFDASSPVKNPKHERNLHTSSPRIDGMGSGALPEQIVPDLKSTVHQEVGEQDSGSMVQGTAETANRGVDVALQEVKTERLIECLRTYFIQHDHSKLSTIYKLAADFAGKEADLDFFLYRTYGYHLDVSKRSAINMEANSDNNDVGAVVISRGFCAGDHRLNDRVLVENGKVSLQLTPRTHVDTAGRKFEQYYGSHGERPPPAHPKLLITPRGQGPVREQRPEADDTTIGAQISTSLTGNEMRRYPSHAKLYRSIAH